MIYFTELFQITPKDANQGQENEAEIILTKHENFNRENIKKYKTYTMELKNTKSEKFRDSSKD